MNGVQYDDIIIFIHTYHHAIFPPHFNIYYYLRIWIYCIHYIVSLYIFCCITFILYATYCLIAHRPFIFNRIIIGYYESILCINLGYSITLVSTVWAL